MPVLVMLLERAGQRHIKTASSLKQEFYFRAPSDQVNDAENAPTVFDVKDSYDPQKLKEDLCSGQLL